MVWPDSISFVHTQSVYSSLVTGNSDKGREGLLCSTWNIPLIRSPWTRLSLWILLIFLAVQTEPLEYDLKNAYWRLFLVSEDHFSPLVNVIIARGQAVQVFMSRAV